MTARAKTNRDMETLIRISRRVGRDSKLVQAGGGNTSVKSADGRLLYVKASGTSLAEMSPDLGHVTMDLPGVLDVLNDSRLMQLSADKREAKVLKRLLALCVGGQVGGRPSVEAALHAILGRYVVHTHPVDVNGLLCARRSREIVGLLGSVCPGEPLYVPYIDPGHPLAVKLSRMISQYKRRHGRMPTVILLENHGLFVSCDSVSEAIRITIQIVGRCDKIWRQKRPRGKKAVRKPISDEALSESLAVLRGAWTRDAGVRPVVEIVKHPGAVRLLNRPDGRKLLEKPLVPDTIAYCGSAAVTLSAANAEHLVSYHKSRVGELPRVALLPGVGFAAIAHKAGQIDAIKVVYSTHVEMVERSLVLGGPRPLSPRANRYIAEWEVERYRRGLAGAGENELPLLNHVAVITGGGGCIGRAIASEVAKLGGRVAVLDIVRADAEETARLIEKEVGPGRALPVVCDVTSEAAVTAAMQKTVLAFGGVDILIAAAAIAPSYPLLDFPLSAWQKTLDINLTGYFLPGREAARVMARQDTGGCIILISSKTGLSASKSHSAYNATKGGEIHMMRGWALELGQYGIRVNSIAPGNVFRGSKLWSPKYFRACARKKGIKPEEVIPYYTRLSALNLEIEPQDIAGVVAFLAGDAGRKISGQTIVCDAGQVFVR